MEYYMKRKLLLFLTIAVLSPSVFSSCTPEEVITVVTEKQKQYNYVSEMMHDVYYWYKDVPAKINATSYVTIFDYFDAHLVSQDRWSWMMTGTDYLDNKAGISTSYGATYSQAIDYYNDYAIRVRYVFPNTPLSENGVKRGWELTHLNGTPVMDLVRLNTFETEMAKASNSFTFKDLAGVSKTFTASSRVISTRSFLKTEVYTSAEFPGLPRPVGYFNYYTFNATMLSDIEQAMATFKTAGIKELILDLRYNGGGDGEATALLANYIAPSTAEGKIVARREHNDKYSKYDSEESTITRVKRLAGSLNLDRLFILGSKGTASASEVILNGFKPLMTVVQVGTTTYGKPNGMYVLPYPEEDYTSPDYVFLPICFFSVNSVGEGHYVDGIAPDQSRPDDLYHDFGVNEDWVKSCLTYITTGSLPALPAKPAAAPSVYFRGKMAVDEDSPNYGKYVNRMPK